MSNIQIFNYQSNEVRTVEMGGEPWFVLKDVCAVLGISHITDTAKRMDEEYQRMESVWGLTAAETIRMPQQGLGELLQGVRRHVR